MKAPENKKKPAHDVVLYTRRGCHLCEQARELLIQFGVDPTMVDIDEDSTLRAQFDCVVPVVAIDGRVRFRGRIDPLLLRRLLQAD